jgi:predicted ATP-dependent protease
MVRELAVDELAWRCPADWVPWQSSSEIEPASTIVGQDRAVDAIAFGLAVESVGYNVFITGLSGTGRLTTISRFLDQLAGDVEPPDDVCFVHNFRTPEEPSALFLRAGAGRRFKQAMEVLVRELAANVPGILGNKEFRRRLERAVADLQQRERELVEAFEKEVKEAGFSLVQVQAGPMTRPEILPVVGDRPTPLEELHKPAEGNPLPEDELKRIADSHSRLTERLQDVFQDVAGLRRQAQQRLEETRRELLAPTFADCANQVRRAVDDPRIEAYLEALREDLSAHLELFVTEAEGEDPFLRWRVNVAVDNADLEGVPVVLETEPTYTNLFGTIERSMSASGEVVSSFLKIRAGSLLRANGGFLVLNAEDLLLEPRVWPGLKRALKFRRVQIQSLESLVLGASALKPEPVPLKVKVVVIGDRSIYDLLYRYDSDFAKVFKVLADFDSIMPTTRAHARDVLSVLRKVAADEQLLPMDRSAMVAMLEEAVRQGHGQRRFSSRFSDLADLQREASHLAQREGAQRIGAAHVAAANEAYERRHGLTEDRTHDLITDGVIRVETAGARVGQVNGLAVYDLGHHRFGTPTRITARVGLGREGVVNIERQAGLSGPTHDKGVSILTGFLRGTFAQRVPLTMSCSITFEQSYGGIDGDSASSTEVYAILSALSGLPIRQDLAVTGSVDQHGHVQAIGGVNEKIEGFFRVCASRELTGSQGVLVPVANVADLQLGREVIEAVSGGRFHIWEVATIEDGIEVLTGVPAGALDDRSGWSEGSVYGRCQRRLEEMAELMRAAAKGPERPGGEGLQGGTGNDDGDSPGATAGPIACAGRSIAGGSGSSPAD